MRISSRVARGGVAAAYWEDDARPALSGSRAGAAPRSGLERRAAAVVALVVAVVQVHVRVAGARADGGGAVAGARAGVRVRAGVVGVLGAGDLVVRLHRGTPPWSSCPLGDVAGSGQKCQDHNRYAICATEDHTTPPYPCQPYKTRDPSHNWCVWRGQEEVMTILR